jgi:hypothetical protein
MNASSLYNLFLRSGSLAPGRRITLVDFVELTCPVDFVELTCPVDFVEPINEDKNELYSFVFMI